MHIFYKHIAILFILLFGIFSVQAQISVTATSGTVGPTSYTTLKGAFDAINLGTHKGDIVIKVNGNTVETATAVLNASGAGSSNYTSINIYPTAGSLSIGGNLAAPVIDFNGADNVTIDGRRNFIGNTDLAFYNNNTGATATTSTIRFISKTVFSTPALRPSRWWVISGEAAERSPRAAAR